jgi:hypothetical protein
MRPDREYWQLRRYLEAVVDDTGHGGDQLPLIYFGAMVALAAMNSKDADPIDAFERLRLDMFGKILSGETEWESGIRR